MYAKLVCIFANEFNLTDIFFNLTEKIIMKIMDFDKIAKEEIVLSRRDEGNFNLSLKNEVGNIQLQVKNMKEISIYKWQSLFSEATQIRENTTPSVRFFALNQSKNGVKVKMKNLDLTIQQGMFNVLFVDTEEEGCDLFRENDHTVFSSFFISNDRFLHLANTYPEVFQSFLNQYQRDKNFILSDRNGLPLTSQMNTILQQLEQSHLMGNVCETYAEIKILELFILQQQLLGQHIKTKKHCKTQSDIDKIHEVRHLLMHNFHAPLSLSELSRRVGLNENKLKYGFKEIFGTTVFGYLFDHKMQLAKQLLLETNKSISEIAEACGYDYVSHFSTAFKRKYHVSPLKFRE
ncbi:Transcriptional regulator, AraC family [Capnocytophaga canis]|uniref:Transcriptional regulator, AraC family n=2 Tax=Capnocytophaga canis TaxID=1848903 RepID=A0A0B7I5A0_9FLAO|nr:Transcriptional regulator, AraC family [Capnocytophaga canis]